MHNRILFFICLLLSALQGLAQTGIITGRVVDAQTSEGLPNANIFIDQTTFGVAADADGNFVFRNVPVGNALVVFSFVGYKPYQAGISVEEGKTSNLIVRLQAEQEQLDEVQVQGSKDKKWEANLRRFNRLFFGADAVGVRCSIANPWVLEFSQDPETRDFIATAIKPLEISNPMLGYDMRFTIKDFRYSTSFYRIAGNAQFMEKPSANAAEVMEQMRRRKESYVYSDRYFFKSIIDNKLEQNGFRIYVEKPRFESSRSSVFSAEVGKSVVPWKPGPLELDRQGVYRIKLPPKMEIHNNQLSSDRRVYKDINFAVSWMEVKGGYVLVNRDGVLMNPGVVVNSGEMDNIRVGRMLPLNYTPDATILVAGLPPVVKHERLREKAYLITDRQTYYPGEKIRVKALMNYGDPLLRDSLSGILHVDLFNSRRDYLFTEHLAIDSGMAYGAIRLPDSLRRGVVYLRAYTNWMRNYGTGSFFVRPLYVMNPEERAWESQQHVRESSGWSWQFDSTRHEIRIALRDSTGEVVPAHLAVSITDALQAPAVTDTRNIFDDHPIKRTAGIPHMDFIHPIRRYLRLSGRTISNQGKPFAGKVLVMVGTQGELYESESDASGRFTIDSLFWTDSTSVAVQARTKKDKAEGKVEWDRFEAPAADFALAPYRVSVEKLFAPVVVVDPSSTLLKQVTVTENRPVKKESRSYGTPDHIITGEQLLATKTGASLINSLQGKVPGMQIISTADQNGISYKIIMRGGTTSILGSLEPQIFINGVPSTASDGRAATVLDQINPIDVERIEIITRTNAMMGSLGSNGLIAVYTKMGVTNKYSDKGFQASRIKGVQVYRTQDNGVLWGEQGRGYRGTLYWNPRVIIGEGDAGVAIPFVPPYNGRFRIVAEGISSDNKPLRGVWEIDLR